MISSLRSLDACHAITNTTTQVENSEDLLEPWILVCIYSLIYLNLMNYSIGTRCSIIHLELRLLFFRILLVLKAFEVGVCVCVFDSDL